MIAGNMIAGNIIAGNIIANLCKRKSLSAWIIENCIMSNQIQHPRG